MKLEYAIEILTKQWNYFEGCSEVMRAHSRREITHLEQAIKALELVQKGKPPREVVEKWTEKMYHAIHREEPMPIQGISSKSTKLRGKFLIDYFKDCFKGEGE